MYNKENIEKIAELVREVMNRHNIKSTTEPTNLYRTIRVDNSATRIEDNLYIWIRLLYVKEDKYIAEISSIELPVNARRKGILTDLYSNLLNCEFISEVRITGVCTDEMRNWCEKHKLKSYNDSSDYTSKTA